MNQVLSLVRAARASANPGSRLGSVPLLSELLALNEGMIAQLRLERLEDVSAADFLTSLIAQHEKAAATLRAQLEAAEDNARLGPNRISKS